MMYYAPLYIKEYNVPVYLVLVQVLSLYSISESTRTRCNRFESYKSCAVVLNISTVMHDVLCSRVRSTVCKRVHNVCR
jgi:hypothetical protein